MKVSDCKIVDLPKIAEPSGNLTFIESARHVPFQIARVYYLYDVPGGAERGGHAHTVVEEFLVAIAGSFDVLLDDGREKARFHLNRSFYGLYIPRMIWRELGNFSSGSVCLVLASEYYDDCSTDNSVSVIDTWLKKQRLDWQLIRHNRNIGICASLNEALRLARGKYISIVAADDVWLAKKTARQVHVIEQMPDDVGVLY